MFISIILDTEYMGMDMRFKWFLKNVSHTKRNNWVIITHQYLQTHFEELNSECLERFYDEFEMEHIRKEDLDTMDIYYIPDSVFDQLYQQNNSRTEMILNLTNERNELLEYHIEMAIRKGLIKRKGENLEGIFNNMHSFQSIKYIAEKYKCKLISYTFSAIRKVHGYALTLYMANITGNLFDDKEIKERYKDFYDINFDFEFFEKAELLILLGKERNFPLIPLINTLGKYEVGIAGEMYQLLPQSYENAKYTDDDIYYECERHYSKDDIVTRSHPGKLSRNGIGRNFFQNDPVTFLLSCKRIATLHSQIILKAFLWNRVACVKTNELPFSFLCCNDYTGKQTISIKDLNFLMFSYLIPSKLIFDIDYWRWRMGNPSESDIFFKHLYTVLNEIMVDTRLLRMSGDERYFSLYRCRGGNNKMMARAIKVVEKKEYNYKYLLSTLKVIYQDDIVKFYYCLNEVKESFRKSIFDIENAKKIQTVEFFPLDGISGFVRLIEISGIESNVRDEEVYLPKGTPIIRTSVCNMDVNEVEVAFCWKGYSLEEGLECGFTKIEGKV